MLSRLRRRRPIQPLAVVTFSNVLAKVGGLAVATRYTGRSIQNRRSDMALAAGIPTAGRRFAVGVIAFASAVLLPAEAAYGCGVFLTAPRLHPGGISAPPMRRRWTPPPRPGNRRAAPAMQRPARSSRHSTRRPESGGRLVSRKSSTVPAMTRRSYAMLRLEPRRLHRFPGGARRMAVRPAAAHRQPRRRSVGLPASAGGVHRRAQRRR